ncbi:MAG: DUF3047 domain-containing protein [Gemmatimonadota bacterium]|nr:DUF3047 domain-containing protein [Gemmatimonadota bacterium]
MMAGADALDPVHVDLSGGGAGGQGVMEAQSDTLLLLVVSRPEGEGPVVSGGQPAGLMHAWEMVPFTGDRVTEYTVADAGGRLALCASSDGAASALVRELEYDPARLPLLRFRLRVLDTVEGGDLTRKEGDDFPARIFVNFRFDSDHEGYFSRLKHTLAESAKGRKLPGHSLNYVWGNRHPPGTTEESAYSDRVQTIVVQSGPDSTGTWWEFERNIVEDYVRSFDKPAPSVVSIGIMTDSDDTGSKSAGCYGGIEARGARSPQDR